MAVAFLQINEDLAAEPTESTQRERPKCFVLTKYRPPEIILPMRAHSRVPDAVETLQKCYPQIYLACHAQHIRAASTVHQLSARDSSILAHLSPTQPLSAGELAAHMGIGVSTLSAAISRLASLGYLKRESSTSDRRAASLTLTSHGARAMAATSVLDAQRLRALVAKLSPEECRRALEGMELLARASRQLADELKTKKNKTRKRI